MIFFYLPSKTSENYCKEKVNNASCRFWSNLLFACGRACVSVTEQRLTTSVFWQAIRSQSLSNCLQPLPHRSCRKGSWEEYLQAWTTVRLSQTPSHTQYIPANSSIVAWQEEPREPSSQMCPLALMAASTDWKGKTPWRIIHLNSPPATSRDKLIGILWSPPKHACPLIHSTLPTLPPA